MNQTLIALHQLNENYHEWKEKRTWEALSIYLGFSLISMTWLIGNQGKWTCWPWPVPALCLSLIAFLPAFGFIRKQIFLKAKSAKMTDMYMDFMLRCPDPTAEQFAAFMMTIQHFRHHQCLGQRCMMFWKEGWPGVWALIAAGLFFLFQVGLILMLVLLN